MKMLVLFTGLSLAISPTGFGQMISRPAVYTRSNTADVMHVLPDSPRASATQQTSDKPKKQEAFSKGNISIPTNSNSQFAASSRVYSLSVYGTPKCTPGPTMETCVSRYWFRAAVDANVVNAVNDEAGAIREYLFSQNGSPVTVSIPTRTWTTKKGDVQQSWFAGSFFGSGRLIPITGTKSSLTGGGAVSFGGTGQIDIEFEATDPGTDPNGKDTVYPGTLYISISPSISALAGGPLKATIFHGSPASSSWTWGGDFRAGFEFQGRQPISLGITGTFSGKGITASDKGVAISLSKLFGGAG